MNWLKTNPFLGGLALFTAVAAAAGLYFVSGQSAAFTEQINVYASNVSKLNSLQSATPFPDGANLKAVEEESERTTQVLSGLASEVAEQSAPRDNALTPQQFQDKLSQAASAVIEQAKTSGVVLPENFYLGFSQYQTQPPSALAAPSLGQQLASISNVVGILLQSRVREITTIERVPLPEESTAEIQIEARGEDKLPELLLAPYDLEFVADQANFRQALSSVANATPMVLIRLVSVSNSRPTAPSKESPAENNESNTALPDQPPPIPVLFGQETLTVKLRLESVSVSTATANK